MSIRIGNSCVNCQEMTEEQFCSAHQVKVNDHYTCDSFEMQVALKNDPNCETCSRYNSPSCANPQKAAPGMLCSHWAPMNAAQA
jgi:hypothetical protein